MDVGQPVHGAGVRWDGCTGYGTRWVLGRGYTGYPASSKAEADTSGAGPVSPCKGLEWVGICCSAHCTSGTTLRARSVLAGPPCTSSSKPASWPIGARFEVISCKVSQNHEVSPKSVHKACHTPYSQNGLQKSPLGFLRIPYSLAFSHKELMVPFWAYLRLYGQNDEVSTECTRAGRSDTPTVMRSKLLLHDRSSSDLAGCRIDPISDILNGSIIY